MTAHQIKPRQSSLVKPSRDPRYLKWIRTQRCVVCGVWRRDGKPNEAAHTGSRGKATGQKATDYDALPLCEWCHRTKPMAYHLIGSEEKWAEHHGLDLEWLRVQHISRYPGPILAGDAVAECGR